MAQDVTAVEVDGDEPRLLIGRDEYDGTAHVRQRSRRERKSARADDEFAPLHFRRYASDKASGP